MNMKKVALLAGILATCVGMQAQAASSDTASANAYQGFQAGDIMVRGRLLSVIPNTISSVSAIGGQVSASKSLEPEVDLTYFFTPHFAVEAIAAITRHHLTDKGSSIGNVDLGHTTLLPPTVTAQYHFMPTEAFSPYVGAGINYTIFFDSTLPAGGAVHSINYENGFGEAIQAGADYHVSGNWYANIDVKHIFLATKAKINGGAINGYVNVDPTIVGLGVGYKF